MIGPRETRGNQRSSTVIPPADHEFENSESPSNSRRQHEFTSSNTPPANAKLFPGENGLARDGPNATPVLPESEDKPAWTGRAIL